MSSIPNSAMPHAQAREGQQDQSGGGNSGGGSFTESATKFVSDGAGKLADLARENPKTAIAAGVVAAGAIAAAAIPALRGGSGGSKSASSGGTKKKSTAKA